MKHNENTVDTVKQNKQNAEFNITTIALDLRLNQTLTDRIAVGGVIQLAEHTGPVLGPTGI